MKVRTVYFKVKRTAEAAQFWGQFLRLQPQSESQDWIEFLVGDVRIAMIALAPDPGAEGCTCVPVFELSDAELPGEVERARSLGARVVFDGLDDPEVRSIVLADPYGHEFELSRFHG
jgi:hypothetical protein